MLNMKRLLAAAMLLPLALMAREATVTSPDGKLVVTINDNDGLPTYAITLDGQPVLQPSALGLKANFADFTRGLSIVETRAAQIDRSYDMRQVKQSHFHYQATQLIVDFENAKKQKVSLEMMVSNNDVALRYLLPRQDKDNPKCAVIESEATSFSLPDGTTTFICPQIGPMKGWERTKPSYEEEYKPDAPMNVKSQFGQGYTFPCLFRVAGETGTAGTSGLSRKSGKPGTLQPDSWVLINETGITGQYCGAHLSDYDAAKGYTIAYPQAGENNGFGSTGAQISLPGSTPWRTITVGNSLKPIVETTVQYDVVEPLYEPSVQYKGGRYTWSWLIWQDNSINWDDQIAFIDLAATMGYEYCLVDGFWDETIGRDRIAELSRYAQSKGVSLMLWYNSNGAWNDAPQTPRNRMSNSIARDQEMAWMKSIGVKGIKVDFFAGDKQETMRLYEEILYDANRYGIQCIFHGCTLPRGWERMYPNYVSSEAVLASENVYFSDYHAKQEGFQLTMHPFCRNAVAAMDWGGVIMTKHMSRDNKKRHQRQTTDIFEMATGIINQAVINCVAIQPNNLEELPQFELDWLKAMPTAWDETRFIDGYPGRYVVLARRHGDQWYVAGLNGTDEPLKLNLSLPMFQPKQTLTLYIDDRKSGEPTLTTVKTDKNGMAKVELQPRGGVIIQ